MNLMTVLTEVWQWLVDFYLAAGLLLLLLAAWTAFVRQPARRMAMAWAAVVGLFGLAVVTVLPNWPRVSLAEPRFVSSRDPGDRTVVAPDPYSAMDANADQTGLDPAATSQPAAKGLVDLIREHGLSATSAVYLTGSAMALMWLATGAVLTRRLRNAAHPAPEPIQKLLLTVADGEDLGAEVMYSENIHQPLAVGIVTPRIILPERFLEQESSEALQAALMHEWAHVRNGDLKMLACLRLLLPVLFAHPLYWWLRAGIRTDQELLADAAVCQRNDVAEYAEILLDWFRINAPGRSRIVTATLGLWEHPHLLKRRIDMLLNDQFQVETRVSSYWRGLSWFVLVGAFSLVSVVTFRSETVLVADEPIAPPVVIQLLDETPILTGAGATDEQPPASTPAAEGKYTSADEAFRAGAVLYNSGRFAESQQPLEAALALAPNDQFRLKVYDALRAAYRLISDEEKMFEACDFILRHADTDAKRSLTRTELLAFVYQRGKVDQLLKRYEEVLKKNAKDRTALYVLSEAYDRLKMDPRHAAELTQRLLALEGKDKTIDVGTNAKLAMQFVRQKKYREGAELYEKLAPLDDSLAAWHWKEAADAWLKARELDKAREAAKRSALCAPEKRSELLTYFWHRALGDVFLATGESKLAVQHLQKAIENTKIEGYLNECRQQLAKAQQQAGT